MTNLTIEQALGDQYLMFYNAAWPAEELHPVCTLPECVDRVNRELRQQGRNIGTWNNKYEVARLLRANWIYQRLGTEPIRKPILTHFQDNKLIVDCGDTRLMSLSLLIDPGEVSVVCTVEKKHADQFADWTPVHTNRDLIRVTEFGRDADILVRGGTDCAIEWLEIGDKTTAHHLHDVDRRIAMMQNYLGQQPADFAFSVDWARNYINWESYAN